jgi:hypothetical protein
MGEKLFSYGTLQLEKVQLKNFGRKLVANPDILEGYEIRDCLIKDSEVIRTSGKSNHPIACFTGNSNDIISGTTFDMTIDELREADRYEVDDYKRIKCTLNSGEQAWVYVQSGLSIDTKYLENSSIKLKIFQDHHIPTLYEKAQDLRIWEHQLY